ncbi:MAG: Ig-like domain-containing protein, partial [Burkholderiales bacterium]
TIKVNANTGKAVLNFQPPGNVYALSIDDRANAIWVFGEGKLYQYDFDGNKNSVATIPKLTPLETRLPPLRDIALHEPLANVYCAADGLVPDTLPPEFLWRSAKLAANPDDGSVWLGVGSLLYQYSPEGFQLSKIKVPGLITSVSLDRKRSRIWLSTCRDIRVYEADGTPVMDFTAGDRLNWISDSDYDTSLDQVWISRVFGLERYDAAGSKVFDKRLHLLDKVLGLLVEHVSADGRGNIWVGHGGLARYFNAQGKELTKSYVSPDLTSFVGIDANKADQTLWVASKFFLVHIGTDGKVIRKLPLHAIGGRLLDRILALAVYVDLIPPEITIESPTEGQHLNNPRQTLKFEWEDIGSGVDPDTLAILIDGNPLDATCTTSDTGAECVPDAPIADGPHTISATVEDRGGNVSEPADRSFVIDTVGPVITVETPADGSYTNVTETDVTGSLNK